MSFCNILRRYFADVKAMKQQNGRAFLSELELVAKVDSAVFPHVECNDLRGLAVTPAELMRGKCVSATHPLIYNQTSVSVSCNFVQVQPGYRRHARQCGPRSAAVGVRVGPSRAVVPLELD
jgi:hypothetical protein